MYLYLLIWVYIFKLGKFIGSVANKLNLKLIRMKKGMIKVSVFYPAGERKTFNTEYYFSTHIPPRCKNTGRCTYTGKLRQRIGGRGTRFSSPVHHNSKFVFQLNGRIRLGIFTRATHINGWTSKFYKYWAGHKDQWSDSITEKFYMEAKTIKVIATNSFAREKHNKSKGSFIKKFMVLKIIFSCS